MNPALRAPSRVSHERAEPVGAQARRSNESELGSPRTAVTSEYVLVCVPVAVIPNV
jgi:hypothetical protein